MGIKSQVKKPVLYAVLDNGCFIQEPTIYTETAKDWIIQGFTVTVFNSGKEVDTIDLLMHETP